MEIDNGDDSRGGLRGAAGLIYCRLGIECFPGLQGEYAPGRISEDVLEICPPSQVNILAVMVQRRIGE